MVNLHNLRLRPGPGFPMLWNRLLDELQRNTLASVSPPLTMSGDTSGVRLGVILPSSRPVAVDAITAPFYGLAAADWTDGESLYLTPCDANGAVADPAPDDVQVNIPTAWGEVDLTSATVGGEDDVAVTCKIASGTPLQYAYAAAGVPVLIGLPPTVVEFLRYDNSTYKLQQRVRWLFGTNVSTLSDWIDLVETEESKKVSCTTPGS